MENKVSPQERELIRRLVNIKTKELSEFKNIRYNTTRVSYEWQKIANDLNHQNYSLDFIKEYLSTLKVNLINNKIIINDNLPGEAPDVTNDFIDLIEKQIIKIELKKIQPSKNETAKTGNNQNFIDLSNTKDINKVRYLIELGIVDYLNNSTFQHSKNALASALSGVTGIKQTTIQSYINAYLTNPTDKNNPMNNINEVNKVKQTLIKLGYSKQQ